MVQHPIAAFATVQRLGQKVVHVQNLDALTPHNGSKDIMILLRLLDPENIVKKQLLAV